MLHYVHQAVASCVCLLFGAGEVRVNQNNKVVGQGQVSQVIIVRGFITVANTQSFEPLSK